MEIYWSISADTTEDVLVLDRIMGCRWPIALEFSVYVVYVRSCAGVMGMLKTRDATNARVFNSFACSLRDKSGEANCAGTDNQFHVHVIYVAKSHNLTARED